MSVSPDIVSRHAAAEALPGGNPAPHPRAGSSGMLLLGATLIAAVAFRAYLIVSTDFPINDGALFYEFVRAVAVSFPGLPRSVAFNGLDLPFAYPPLTFWLAAWLTRFGLDALAIVHVMPIVMNALYVGLIAALLLRSGRSAMFTALALAFFCLTIESFAWLVMGGGLSRGLGSLFLVMTLLAIGVPVGSDRFALSLTRVALAGACVGGAILSHLEWGILAATTLVASRALAARSLKDFVVHCTLAGAIALAAILPWLAAIYQNHGLEPFTAASGTSDWGIRSALVGIASIGRAGLANPFIIVALVLMLRRRDYFWIVFGALCIFATPRHAPTPVSLPFAILAAQGALGSYAFLLRVLKSRGTAVVLVGIAAIAFAGSNLARTYGGYRTTLRPLSAQQREAMAWANAALPGARVAIVGPKPWFSQASAEWFPVLTRATGVNVVQGREWLPGNAFLVSQADNERLRRSGSCSEVERGLAKFGTVDFIWAEKFRECFAAAGYKRVFGNSAVVIFEGRDHGR